MRQQQLFFKNFVDGLQMDEFISRFNYEKDILGKPNADKHNSEMRKQYLRSLFNEELFENSDAVMLELYEEFVCVVTDAKQPAFIHFTDTDWIAEATCNLAYNGKSYKTSIFLRIEHIEGFKYKWVIIGVNDSIFTLQPNRQNTGIIISPTDNELRFMSLPDLTGKNRKDIINYLPHEYHVDKLTVLNTLVYTGQLKIEYVEKVRYHFFQVNNYVFTVEHFERDSDNSGWLISKTEKVKESEKLVYWSKIDVIH